MNWIRELGRRPLMLLRGGQFDADLDEEMRLHRELREQEQIERGLSPKEARYAVQRRFGNELVLREESRDMWGWNWLENLVQDIRYGLRMLRKNPGFTAVAVLTLALGIGANTAIFSLMNAILLTPLPYREPQSLVRLKISEPGYPGDVPVVSGPDFEDWQKQNRVFEEMAAGFVAYKALTSTSEPMQIGGFEVSPQVFHLLGIEPLLGRTFTEDEGQPGRNHVVIVTYGLWQRAFGGDEGIVGRSITLGGQAYDVVGVMPRSLKFPDLWWGSKAEFWIPLNLKQPAWRASRESHWLWALARMKKGVTLDQSQADMATISRNLQQQYPETNTGINVRVLSVREEVTKQVKPALLVLFAAVGFLLLIACVNIANLLVARGAGRSREIAVRLALGSSRLRLVRQLITESVLLFILGGASALLVGWGAMRILVATAPEGYIPSVVDARFGGWASVFTFGVAILTGFFAGLVPALQASMPGLQGALKEGGRNVASSGRRVRSVLTAVEIALACVMLIGAGLTIKSLVRLMGVQPGFDPEHVLKAYVPLPESRYKEQKVPVFFEHLLERVRVLPGVVSASATDYLPLTGNPGGQVYIEGQPAPKTMWAGPGVAWCSVLPDYFHTMRIPILDGRDFTIQDGPKSPRVAIINQTMARTFWPDQNALGKRFARDYKKPEWITVVGVVGNVNESALDEPATPEAYFPELQHHDSSMAIVIRTSTPPLNEVGALRGVVHSLDCELPVAGIGTMSEIFSQSSARQRFVALLLSLFAGTALVLALIGIYGVISYFVAQRTHEIGLRIALGAEKGDVLRLVVSQGMILASIGAGIGVVGALGLTRFLSSLLYGVKPTDPLTFISVSIALPAVALLACFIPARRAAKVDPMVALRYE